MDIDAVRVGAVLICPVKVPGGGVYMGDMHAMQGDGEIAGHTTDVAGTVTLQVHLLKGLSIDGPVLFPIMEDLPWLARPFSEKERERALAVARNYGMDSVERALPISVVGTRSRPQCSNRQRSGSRGTASGNDRRRGEKPRHHQWRHRDRSSTPESVQVTFLAPVDTLEKKGLLRFAEDQYGAAAP